MSKLDSLKLSILLCDLDAIHYKIKEDGRYVTKAVYTILALDLEGKKEVLGLYLK
ncbi:transposase mutator type [Helicobacter cetorum MIT 99-5656]|uniref:Mutator family transposase n=1 Tax=Helicobacter cetorum (strain ATCC BAA-540 / CCUG 52418 / MIT 99-5656) TaxID=1163745 RepID=I0EQZ7_HELCM|nr:transposase mutator type [Helicobacter cetorum MIT 99-5656]